MRPLARLAPALTVAALALAPAAAHADPAPFGHACAAQDGVRFCPPPDLASRVPSFDGVPLDVDVTLPATGDGPFPTILLLHGLGQTKTAFEGTGSYSTVAFARRGYAVVTPTARGFGNSCGVPASRTAGCEQGFTRLDDMRYEIHDIQYLAGLLVDGGIVRPDAIGATGVSYGGGASTMLAYLRDRVRNVDGSFSPWTSPNGTPLRIAAAWPRWLWTNGASIFTRNGRGAWSQSPVGVVAQAYADLIFSVPSLGFVEPTGGSDLSADIIRWKQLLDTNRVDAEAQSVLGIARRFHGVAALSGTPAPLLFQTGWTDALFPVPQTLPAYDALLRADRNAQVSLQVGDLGHSPGANHPRDTERFDAQGARFFDAVLRGVGSRPKPGSVTAFTMTCPKTAPSGGGPFTAPRFSALARGVLRFGTRRTLRITSKGASAALASDLNPVAGTGTDLCIAHRPDRTSHATLGIRSPGMTLIGLPVITGRVVAKGTLGQLDARMWDLDPRTGTQRLITRGTYRLADNQAGAFRFALDGNGWRFAKGHRIVVELLGRDAPTYGPSPSPFTATLRRLRVTVPVRERPSAARSIRKP